MLTVSPEQIQTLSKLQRRVPSPYNIRFLIRKNVYNRLALGHTTTSLFCILLFGLLIMLIKKNDTARLLLLRSAVLRYAIPGLLQCVLQRTRKKKVKIVVLVHDTTCVLDPS